MRWWWVLPKLMRLVGPPLFLAFGVTLGGGLLGSFGHWLVGQQNQADASQIAYKIRIWAVAVAIGGALTALENFDKSVSARALGDLIKGGLTLSAAYTGAEMGYLLLRWWMAP